MRKALQLFILLTLVHTSCKNVQKMVDKGEYDEAIVYAAEKLQGEENKETKYVKALEDAFERVMAQDLARIDHMTRTDRPEFYGKLFQVYKKIEKRQSRIRPFLPLISEDGYVGHFKMIDTRIPLDDYAEKDAGYHYNLAQQYLDEYAPDKKFKARLAYNALSTVRGYFDRYEDSDEMMLRAKRLGTEYVYVYSQVSPYTSLDPGNWEYFERIDVTNMNKEWVVFHNRIDDDISYDFKAVVELTDVKVEAERERAHTFHYSKEIQDGWEYELDKRGNVKKDSLGNDIKIPKYETVKAEVIEVERQKNTHLLAEVVITDLHSGTVVERHPIDAHIDFHGFSCRVRGDKRAIDGADRKHRMDRHLEPFPLDEVMIHEGILSISKEASKKIKRHFS